MYTLWQYAILPILYTPGGVIPVLIGGADLMTPGVIVDPSAPLPQVSRGQLVSVAERNGNIMAVGIMAIDTADIPKTEKGKAVFNFHTYKDALWEMGTKSDPKPSLPLTAPAPPNGDSPEHEPTGGMDADTDALTAAAADIKLDAELSTSQSNPQLSPQGIHHISTTHSYPLR